MEQRLYEKLDELFNVKIPEEGASKDVEKEVSLIDRKIQKLIKLAQDEDSVLEEVEKQIRNLKEQRARVLAQKITEIDYAAVRKRLRSIKKVYPFMSREEKSRMWHILIKRITAENNRLIVEWSGGSKRYVILRGKLPIRAQVWCGRGDLNPQELITH